jgi:hypothetical protein
MSRYVGLGEGWFIQREERKKRMATTSMGFGMDEQEYDAGFDTGDEAARAAEEPVDNADAETGPGEDEFWGNSFDPAEMAEALKVDLPPEGKYEGQGLTVTERKNTFDGHPELYCFGTVLNSEGKKASVRFNISPLKRYKDNGKLAWDYQLYKQALVAYVVSNGQEPRSKDEFKNYLTTGQIKYRLVRNLKGTGMQVMEIKGIRN